MKLFRVTVETEFFVAAEDDDDAYRVARANYEEALAAEYPDLMFTSEVSDIKTVPPVWRKSLPWGKGPDLTCEQLLEASKSQVE